MIESIDEEPSSGSQNSARFLSDDGAITVERDLKDRFEALFEGGTANGIFANEAEIPVNGQEATVDGFELNYQQIFLDLINLTDEPYVAYQAGPGRNRLLQYEEYSWTGKLGVRMIF